jgi:hypothetical protein
MKSERIEYTDMPNHCGALSVFYPGKYGKARGPGMSGRFYASGRCRKRLHCQLLAGDRSLSLTRFHESLIRHRHRIRSGLFA